MRNAMAKASRACSSNFPSGGSRVTGNRDGASLPAALSETAARNVLMSEGPAGALAIVSELGGRDINKLYGMPAAFPVGHFLGLPEMPFLKRA